MQLAKQQLPKEPKLPDRDVRLLRAKLILEEALETVTALGFTVDVAGFEIADKADFTEYIDFIENGRESLEEIADGCCDISVVTMGTLSACGLKDQPLLEAVDENNLRKFENRCPKCDKIVQALDDPPGQCACHDCGEMWVGGHHNEYGKLIKPPGHKPPDIQKLIEEQML